jgi:hypothetical protein
MFGRGGRPSTVEMPVPSLNNRNRLHSAMVEGCGRDASEPNVRCAAGPCLLRDALPLVAASDGVIAAVVHSAYKVLQLPPAVDVVDRWGFSGREGPP